MSRKSRIATMMVALSLVAGGAVMAGPAQIAPPAGTPAATQHLNPNTATEAQLRAVPNVSAALATDIIRGRPYASPSDLHKVVGTKIPAAQLTAFYAAVFVPLKLNTATKADIELIPGMTPQMVREFEEYRPYSDMSVFRREIGKYVNETELNRLASYVTVN